MKRAEHMATLDAQRIAAGFSHGECGCMQCHDAARVAAEIDSIAADYIANGWTDLGLVHGTRTLQKRSDAASSPFVAIWLQDGDRARVVSEEY